MNAVRLDSHAGSDELAEATAAVDGLTAAPAMPVQERLPAGNLLLDAPVAREANFLQLQVDALLSETQIPESSAAVHKVLDKLSRVLKSVPKQEVTAGALSSYVKTLPAKTQKSLDFVAPSKVEISGAFASETVAMPDCTLTVTVTIPAACLIQKDHLNNQYFAKRAMYLTVLSEALKRTKSFRKQAWEFQGSDSRKPSLMVWPQVKDTKLPQNFRICIVSAVEPLVFPLHKLAPDRNNLRDVCNSANKNSNGEPELLPTPHYNSSLLQDIFPMSTVQAIKQASSQLPHFLDACLLLKVWARQQGLTMLSEASPADVLPCFAAHLAQAGKLTAAMSSLQIFKAVVKALADPKTFRNGIFMERQHQSAQPAPPQASQFKAQFDCVFVDPSGWLNLMAHLTSSSLSLIQQHAKKAWTMLEEMRSAEEVFESLFLHKAALPASFDFIWRVELPKGEDTLPASDLPFARSQERKVENLARKALGDRAQLVYAFPRGLLQQQSLACTEAEQSFILLAAKVKTDEAFRAVDIGPLADSPDAAAFRQFWGDKSEMRKFLDGRICEAVAWDVGAASRHTIPDKILQYVIPMHIGGHVRGYAGCLDWTLLQKGCTREEQLNARRLADAALVKLGKQLRSLTSLPLKVISLQPISAASRHVDPFSPLPHPYAGGRRSRDSPVPRCITPLECLMQLEASGKWPDNVEAFQKMKAALGVQTAEELFTSFGLRAEASEDCVDVFTDGFVFRLFPCSERDKAVAVKDLQFAVQHNALQNQAKHHGMIAQLAGMHVTLRASTELAIRWTFSQLMSNHLALPAVELIAAAAYIGPGPPPGSPVAGFMGFLKLLALHPWKERPLIVDPENAMDATQRQAAISSFQNAQKDGFAPAMAIATPLDPASAHWTASAPTKLVARRLTALAKHALTQLEDVVWGPTPTESNMLSIWDPCLADFDALIILRKQAVPSSETALRAPGGKGRLVESLLASAGFPQGDTAAVDPSKHSKVLLHRIPPRVVKEWGTTRIQEELVVGFDPVSMFVALLEQRFGHLATFFYDRCGGNLVAIKWSPQAFIPQPPVAEIAHTAMPIDTDLASVQRPTKRAKHSQKIRETVCVPDVLRISSDVHELGAGLVSEICLKRSPTA